MPAARAAGLSGERIGGEWDVCHCAELHRAAIGGLWCYRTTAIAPRFTIRAWLRWPEAYASGYRMPRLRRSRQRLRRSRQRLRRLSHDPQQEPLRATWT